MAETVRVTGIRELQRAARASGGAAPKLLRARLKIVGQIVRDDSAADLAPLSPISAAGYRVYVRQRGVSVEQSRRRTTGMRPDWGAFQMRRILIPALDRNQTAVREETDKAIDDIVRIFER